MNGMTTVGLRASLLAALVVAWLAGPEATALGAKGGRRGGGHAAPRVPSAHRANKAPAPKPPKMPHAAAPSHANHMKANAAHPASGGLAATSAAHQGGAGRAGAASGASAHAARAATASASNFPYSYTYGSGSGARHYRAYGYGRGYRNHYNGGRRGYGRSQGMNRAIVARLRSAHANLARLDRDYRGHRVRAMQRISMAIRQLAHRSMNYRGMGSASGRYGAGSSARRTGALASNNRKAPSLTQAQSDERMGQSLRTLQGVNMQLTSQTRSTSGHGRARGHVAVAIRELNTALSIR